MSKKKERTPIFGKPVAGLRLSRFCTGFMAMLDLVMMMMVMMVDMIIVMAMLDRVSCRGSSPTLRVRADALLPTF